MKLKLKNLKQQEFDIEIESEQKTVKDLKIEIEKVHGFDANLMKLLHSGQVLEDAKTLEDYKIKEGNVIILMAAKKKQAPPPQPQPEPQAQQNSESKPEEQPKNDTANQNKPDYTDKINSLVEMGYEKEKVEKALNAASGSIELAIEFLNSDNIPEPNQVNQNMGGGSVNIPGTGNMPAELVQQASIMKILCMNNPQKITSLLNIFKERHPDLINLIKQYETEFKNLLVAPISQEDINIFRQFEQEMRRPQGPAIRLTKEESDAVKRLQSLGNFSQAEAVQAYLACDKNEEMAANFLFEQKMREEDEANKNQNNQGQGQGQ
jgi:UV excision repair protein RAD23